MKKKPLILRSPFSVLRFPVVFLFLLASPLLADQPKENQESLTFWDSRERAQPAAAVQLITAPNPLTMVALRIQGKRMLVWNELEFFGQEVPPLNPVWLESASKRDRRPLPDLRGRTADEIPKADKDFYDLYNQALVNAFETPLDAFIHSARENSHVTFAHLYNEPWKYRGQVIPIEGKLARLRKFDAPLAAQHQGVRHLFEAWIFTPTLKSHPVCVITPIIPEGLKPAESMDRWVKFYGYLLNRYRYTSGEGERETLLLVGPSVILAQQPPPPPRTEVVTPALLYGLVGFIVAVALAVGILNWLFRRGDRRIKARLEEIQAQRTLQMLEEAEKPLPPIEGNGHFPKERTENEGHPPGQGE